MSNKKNRVQTVSVRPVVRYTAEELATGAYRANRAATFKNSRRKAARDACRGTKAGRARSDRGE
jgi:hypothetical protein